jgi:hypothetical protein
LTIFESLKGWVQLYPQILQLDRNSMSVFCFKLQFKDLIHNIIIPLQTSEHGTTKKFKMGIL